MVGDIPVDDAVRDGFSRSESSERSDRVESVTRLSRTLSSTKQNGGAMYGYGYGYLIVILVVLAAVAFFTLVFGLVYARRTLGPRTGKWSTYAGWYTFYTVRFIVRVGMVVWLWEQGTDWGAWLALVASVFVLFPSLWWRAISSVTGRAFKPAVTRASASPADDAGDRTTLTGLWAVRAKVLLRASVPWPTVLVIVFARRLVGQTDPIGWGLWTDIGMGAGIDSGLTPIAACAVVTAVAGLISWLLWWRRERTVFDKELPGVAQALALSVPAAWALMWNIARLAESDQLIGSDRGSALLDLGLSGPGLAAALMLANAATLGLLALAWRSLPDTDVARAQTARPSADRRESRNVPAKALLGLAGIAATVVVVANMNSGSDVQYPPPTPALTVPTEPPAPEAGPLVVAVAEPPPPPTPAPRPTVPPTTTAEQRAGIDVLSPYQLRAAGACVEVSAMIRFAEEANATWDGQEADLEAAGRSAERQSLFAATEAHLAGLVAWTRDLNAEIGGFRATPEEMPSQVGMEMAVRDMERASEHMLAALQAPASAEAEPGRARRESLADFVRAANRVDEAATWAIGFELRPAELEVIGLKLAAGGLALMAIDINRAWENDAVDYAEAQTLMEGLIDRSFVFAMLVGTVEPVGDRVDAANQMNTTAMQLVEAAQGMLEGLLLPVEAEEEPGEARREARDAFLDAARAFDVATSSALGYTNPEAVGMLIAPAPHLEPPDMVSQPG